MRGMDGDIDQLIDPSHDSKPIPKNPHPRSLWPLGLPVPKSLLATLFNLH